MGRRPRRSLSAPHFHVVNRSVRRIPIFIRRTDYRAFLAVLQEGFDKFAVVPLAYCVMPNHWHLVLEPAGTAVLIRFMHWVTVTHAVRWHRHHRTVGGGPVYQGRYHAIPIETAEGLMRACRYVERNALSSGMARRAEDWPWCSLAERLRGGADLPLKPAPFFTSSAWVEYVNQPALPSEQIPDPTLDDWRDLKYTKAPAEPRRSGTNNPKSVEKRSDPLIDLPQPPSRLAGGVQGGERLAGAGRRANQNQTDAHVERAKHLVVGNATRALKPREHRRHRPARTVE
jgi:putative transposase